MDHAVKINCEYNPAEYNFISSNCFHYYLCSYAANIILKNQIVKFRPRKAERKYKQTNKQTTTKLSNN